ncbi:MAG: biotin transporter BioY [Defluviitaleaceae bacterium]|nr:biotin transporter BioY [Defluviitaleaceae bacterium]
MERTTSKIISTRGLCYTGLGVAVTCVLAQVHFPLFGVPLTMQTFAVMLIGIILGAKKAAAAMVIYLMLGAAGMPVFTGFGGGVARVVGPWGGFIMSFPAMALIIGYAAMRTKTWLVAGIVAGVIVNLSCGMLWFAFVSDVGMRYAFAVAFLPFVAPEAIKAILAISIGVPVRRGLIKSGAL